MKKNITNIFSLKNKNIIITGAAGLLGSQHAEAVAAFDGNPILLDINKKKLNALVNKINKKYSIKSIGYVVDITNEKKIKENVKVLLKKYRKIDGLINNAANNPKIEKKINKNFSRLEKFPLSLWEKDIAVGLTGAFLCCKHYGYLISKNINGGSIVNISSDLGLLSPDQRLYLDPALNENNQEVKPVSYSIVKTGLIGLSRYLATYWSSKGVRCNTICPGGIKDNQSTQFLKRINSLIPLGRLANANEYQGTLIWMLSDASSYLNGSIIAVDGGRSSW